MAIKYRRYPLKAKLLQNISVCDIVLLCIILFFVPIQYFSRLMIIPLFIFKDSIMLGENIAGFIMLLLYIVEFAMPVCYLIGARKNLHST